MVVAGSGHYVFSWPFTHFLDVPEGSEIHRSVAVIPVLGKGDHRVPRGFATVRP
jgi:hypothetical protein